MWPTSITFLLGLQVSISASSLRSVSGGVDIMRNDTTWNEHAKLWLFHDMAKWRRWRLMLHCWWQRWLSWTRSGVFWRSLDFINITSDDQVTWKVYQNSATIMQSFQIYVYEIATDARTARCRCQKHRRQWPSNHTITFAQTVKIYVYNIATDARTAHCRRQKHLPEMTR